MTFINTHPTGRALDLGCGTGTNLLTLAEHGWQVSGIDFSSRAVNLARRRLKLSSIQADVIQGDVSQEFAVKGIFDLILDIGCYHDLSQDDRAGYRFNIEKHISPGGTFLIYAHCLSPDRARATGVAQEDIDAFSKMLRVKNIDYSTDHWERKTVWMTFINPD